MTDERDPLGDVIIGSMGSPIFPQADDRARPTARGHVRSFLKQEEQACGAADARQPQSRSRRLDQVADQRLPDHDNVIMSV